MQQRISMGRLQSKVSRMGQGLVRGGNAASALHRAIAGSAASVRGRHGLSLLLLATL